MNKEQQHKIGRATYVIVRKFVGKESLKKKLEQLILNPK